MKNKIISKTLFLSNCCVEKCNIIGDTNLKEEFSKDKHIIKEYIKNTDLICSNLFIFKGKFIDCKMKGEFISIFFEPDYCKNVNIGKIISQDIILKINCYVTGGLIFKENINNFIAGLTLLTDDHKYISIQKIEKYKNELNKYFNIKEANYEICNTKPNK